MHVTALTSRHKALGAKMTPFAGFQMPLVYSTVSEEHQAVRNACGIFDVSHMGEFIIKGREALELVQLISSNDAATLDIGEAQYSCLPNHHGGIVDDLLIYRLDEDQCAEGEQSFMLVVNASNIEKDLQWLETHNRFDTRIINISDKTGLLAVQGPKAAEVLQPYIEMDLKDISYYTFRKTSVEGCDNVLLSATGYTGAGGFELYATSESIVKIWDALLDGQRADITPCGLGARDTLRLEMGYCLYGNDIDNETSPLEAGLGWITKLKKPVFHGREIFLKQKEEGVVKNLVGFVVKDRRVPRKGYRIMNGEDIDIGTVTSGTFSPTLEKPIGMGYVKRGYNKTGQEILISTGRKSLQATIVKTPFLK
ncbi:MAG: glycine cleavage system aminomethyltransferase GcvT [Saprospiraceae bacterium]|nr:glycine cleavage system aminomethyltransferase GcvT [Saprospiraceae bacterium]